MVSIVTDVPLIIRSNFFIMHGQLFGFVYIIYLNVGGILEHFEILFDGNQTLLQIVSQAIFSR